MNLTTRGTVDWDIVLLFPYNLINVLSLLIEIQSVFTAIFE
jgi:hypothetical protein